MQKEITLDGNKISEKLARDLLNKINDSNAINFFFAGWNIQTPKGWLKLETIIEE